MKQYSLRRAQKFRKEHDLSGGSEAKRSRASFGKVVKNGATPPARADCESRRVEVSVAPSVGDNANVAA
jgi:hypothetical protein